MLILTQRFSANPQRIVPSTLLLTADERTRSRRQVRTDGGEVAHLRLPRGTVLRDGDLLKPDTGEIWVRVLAKPESVFTIKATTALKLLQAAYHLGNRHVQLEIHPTYLRLSPDPVLKQMLEQLQVEIVEEVVPFQPEIGAYGHHHHRSSSK
ncbi:urease accessory protein UreE [Oscillatoriales cyanobacterium LEGE 11467]|uniref:Urease accessory protein UreE n=2 Tax=Zarconia TaxID=2992130 RepID=A0A928VT23_9CYAN|nr:urease accessory protein UreE [Zarconia navalis LEGE 11467]